MEKSFVKIMNKPRFNQLMDLGKIDDFNLQYKLKHCAVISINDTSGKWSKPWFCENHDNVLRLWFDDVLNDGDIIPKYERVGIKVNDDQLKEIIEFIEYNKNKKRFIVHCSAGISRSGAIGLYITQLFGHSIKDYYKNNPRIKPNKMILQRLSFLTKINKLKEKYKVTPL